MNNDDEINPDKEVEQPRPQRRRLTEAELERWKLEGWDSLPEVFSVEAAAKRLGVSRSTGYECAKDGTLPVMELRRCKRVSRYDLFILLTRGPDGFAT